MKFGAWEQSDMIRLWQGDLWPAPSGGEDCSNHAYNLTQYPLTSSNKYW